MVSLKHFHIWGCPAEARPYKPNERKLEPKTVSSYFIGYSERSRGYKFYDPKLKTIFETGIATFFEDIEFGGRNKIRDIVFQENLDSTFPVESELTPLPVVAFNIPSIDQIQDQEQQDIVDQTHEIQTQQPQNQEPLRRSTRERKNAISNDYIVFLQENEDSGGLMADDPVNIQQAMKDTNSEKWIEAMNEEYKSMQDNKVWKLVSLPEGKKPIGYK